MGGVYPYSILNMFQIKNQLRVFVNALIENPAFSSQTKDVLTTAVAEFGSKCVCDVAAVQTWAVESGLVDELTSEAQAKEVMFKKWLLIDSGLCLF